MLFRSRIGGTVELTLTRRIGRCAATCIDTATGRFDVDLPAALEKRFLHRDFGIYARVAVGGTIRQGDEVTLDDGTTVAFDGASEFANYQISHDPFQPWVLATTMTMLASLVGSLVIKRRRIWIRLRPTADGAATIVEMAGLARTDRAGWDGEFDTIHRALLGLPDPDDVDEEAEKNTPVLIASPSQ